MTTPSSPIPDRAWWPWVVFVAVTLAWLWEPLLGLGSLLPADIVEQFDPWRSNPRSGRDTVHNPFLVDTVTVHVHFASIAADIWSGDFSLWDPSVGTGFPTLKAGLPVFNWVYLLVPAWYAPGLAAALRTLAAAGLTYGLSRRLGVGRGAATVGGMAYGLSGYLIGWSAWPHANVAALLPGLFWAVESLVQRPRPRTSAGLGAVVAAMLWANFPTITFYALLFAALYAAFRLWSRTEPANRFASFRRRGWAALVGLVFGALVAAWHLIHFSEYLRWSDTTARESLPADSSIGGEYIPSLVLPQPYGATHDGLTYWGQTLNWVEVQSYAGLTVVILALLGFGARTQCQGASGAIADRGHAVRVWWGLVILVVLLAYVGGPLTTALNSLPFLGFSTVGRIRVVANLGLAVLAALGVQTWLDARDNVNGADIGWGLKRAGFFAAVLGIFSSPLILTWLRVTRASDAVGELVAAAVVPVVCAAFLIAVLWRWKDAGVGLVIAITVLVGADLVAAHRSVNTVVDRAGADFDTAAHTAASDRLAPGERMAGEGRVFIANTGQVTGLVDARGQLFTPPGYRALFSAIDPAHAQPPGGTAQNPWFADVDVHSPALDRLGVRLWATDPRTPVIGLRGAELDSASGRFVVVGAAGATGQSGLGVPAGGLRAISVAVGEGPVGELRATITAADGEATAVALLDGRARKIDLVVVGGDLPRGARMEVTFTFAGTDEPVLSAVDDGVAFQVVAGGDGLTVVHAGDVVIYDRDRPVGARIAHAVSTDPVTSETHLGPTSIAHLEPTVSAGFGEWPAKPPVDAVATATIQQADGGHVVVEVDTTHPGILVLPMPDYPGWSATVDGESVGVVRVDDAFLGVVVGPGDTLVEFDYTPTRQGSALVLTLLGLIGLFGLARKDRDFAPLDG